MYGGVLMVSNMLILSKTEGYGPRPRIGAVPVDRPTPAPSLASRLRRHLQDGGDELVDWLLVHWWAPLSLSPLLIY
ncbi:hypothetical protein HanIR_Chr12g0563371 [Helianthus annuus]|nr:hypothetical protein HanIR_Chr12g0563371 [Helianthus annuus]